MRILDAHGNKVQLRQIDFVRSEMIIDGIEHIGFHIRGTKDGIVVPRAEMDEATEMLIMEQLTEQYDYLGEPVN